MYDRSISIIGMGYVGIPLSSLLAKDFNVTGFDVDKAKVQELLEGRLTIHEPDLKEIFDASIMSKQLTITDNPDRIKDTTVKIITVGTPYDNDRKMTNYNQLLSSLRIVVPRLKKGDVIVLKSTVPPGTTSKLVRKAVEEAGFVVPDDIGLAFVPERMIEGQAVKDFKTLPKIIGATDDRTYNIVSEMLSSLGGEIIRVSNPETAEMAKMVDNYSRYVFLGLTNELALISEKIGVDVLELISAAKKNYPRNSGLLLPGPGVGGSCLNKDPFILQSELEKKSMNLKMVDAAKEINSYMPLHVTELVRRYARERSIITILGVAFKGDTDDTRFTPSNTISKVLQDSNFVIKLSDPFVAGEKIIPDPYKAIEGSDVIIVLTDHSAYNDLDLDKIYGKMNKKPLIIDTRGQINRWEAESKGFEYHGVGRI